MKKKVVYNGGTDRYYSHGDLPTLLKKDEVYTVIEKIESEFHTEYILAEVPGEYNSIWFDPLKPVFYATSGIIPQVGEWLICCRFDKDNRRVGVNSTPAKSVKLIGIDTYEVRTKNTIYIVQVQ